MALSRAREVMPRFWTCSSPSLGRWSQCVVAVLRLAAKSSVKDVFDGSRKSEVAQEAVFEGHSTTQPFV
jgi:hypothetical protein